MRPFLFPAMGSHGAATAEGQADVLAHYGIIEATMGCPVVSSSRRGSAGQDARRHRGLHGPQRLRERRRHAGGPGEVAHRFRRRDRKRPVQDDGHRPGQVRRRAALSHLRLQAGSGARDPHRRAAGAGVGQDPGRPGHPGRRQPQHRASSTRFRWRRWSSARKNCCAW